MLHYTSSFYFLLKQSILSTAVICKTLKRLKWRRQCGLPQYWQALTLFSFAIKSAFLFKNLFIRVKATITRGVSFLFSFRRWAKNLLSSPGTVPGFPLSQAFPF